MENTNEQKICYLCDSEEVVNESCIKCQKPYCALCASKKIPTLYCFDCMADITVTVESPYIRVDPTDWDLETDQPVSRKYRCKRMVISGASWFFHQRYMSTLSEDELRQMLELCRAQVIYLESEIDAVNVRRRQKQVEEMLGHKPERVQTTVKVRVKPQPTIEDVVDALQKLKAFGMTKEQIDKMIG